MRKFVIFFAAAVLIFTSLTFIAIGFQRGSLEGTSNGAADKTFAAKIATLTEAWAKDQKLLMSYEREQSKIRAEVIQRRRLYQNGLISKAEVFEVEQSLVRALARIFELRRSLIEYDMAITEATLRDHLQRLPDSGLNSFTESTHLTRFNGPAKWSLKNAPGIEEFYFQKFGRKLPITAFGQTATHKRLRFDHRDAMDVALHPDSMEGKALIHHLRESGIPFVAFRNPVAGASTGAHIHIGPPSPRTVSHWPGMPWPKMESLRG
jgi:hypothetical protein